MRTSFPDKWFLDESKGCLVLIVVDTQISKHSIVSLITTAAVVLNYRAPAGFLQRLLNAFLLPLSGLLTARFLLHLRAWEDKQNYGTSGEGPRHTHTDTIGSFHAAPGRGQTSVLSAIIEEFGTDPVARAVAESAQAREVGLATMKAGFEGSTSSGDTSSGGPSSSSWVIR
ncbi:hypothetical protein VNI00_003702 [Paramarasmius palmivorus]|uniref:Uncharacterized protein n=1 Tax=Paramarasmius palmivorus TaxID=297713 RepID=A0AAW0DRW8_9AGAR